MLKTIKLLLILSVFTYAANDVLYTPKSKVFDFTFNDINKNAQTTNTQKVVPKVSYEISSMLGLFPRLFKTKNCPSDSFGNDYCPDSLAEANEEWDYEDGFTSTGEGLVTDYKEKEINFNTTAPIPEQQSIPVGAMVTLNITSFKTTRALYNTDSYGNLTNRIRTYDGNDHRHYQSHEYGDVNRRHSGRLVVNICHRHAAWGQDYIGCTSYYYQTINRLTCPIADGYTLEPNGWKDIDTAVCVKTTIQCPNGFIETTGTEKTKGECKKTFDYKYYEYKCRNEPNSQGYNFSAVNSGGDCNPLSTNDLIDSNNDGIGDSCNMSSPPNNNCLRKKFLCQFNENRPPVWIDNKWQCSPFPCNADKQCGTAICKNYPPSTEYYMPYSMHPIRAKFDGTCNTSICDSVKNNKMSYCESESCPTNAGVYKKNGRCYYDDCPVGTNINTRDQCIEDVN